MVSLQAQAQQNIHTAGGNTSSSAGSVAYSVGQIVYNTHSNAANIISEGVQQPYEISVITANEKIDASYIDVHVYPNPSSQCIKLNVGQTELSKLSYQLSDAQGKLLENKQITSSLSEIAMPPAD